MFELVPDWASHYEEFWLTIRRRNLWFIKLRYGAVFMLIFLIFYPRYFLNIQLSSDQQNSLLVITLLIFFYNITFHAIRKYLKHDAGQFNHYRSHFAVIANDTGMVWF